ncbi:MAG: MBL fold metallo-hydrolase [Planctomycetes bacterium]|nr:MBL fold metallo-hydrolase [Planctomycetota bacterium]
MEVTFLGATGTVTGSKTLVTAGETRILIDCGLYQGVKQVRLRNRQPLPVDAASLEAVILTHAHTDHSGWLPRLCLEGFRGPIYCTPPTRELAEIMLPDSGRLQEEDARYLNKKGLSRHKPALPLYTEKDAQRALKQFEVHPFTEPLGVGPFRVHFREVGHILGAAAVMLETPGGTLCISGDVGRREMVIMSAPLPFPGADWLVLESTYGDRLHSDRNPLDELEAVVRTAVASSSVLLLPAFAVGRSQALLYGLDRIFARNERLRVPVHLDSPMATDVTELYHRYPAYHRLERDDVARFCRMADFVNSVEASKELNRARGPRIIISSSGMIEGGRILHHLKAHAGDPRNVIGLTGFQAPGTRGADIEAGAKAVKIHGDYVPIRAKVVKLEAFSAHADQAELLAWVSAAPRPPRAIFLVHGEPVACDVLRRLLAERVGCPVHVPEYRETVALA